MDFLPGIITVLCFALGAGLFIFVKTNPSAAAQLAKWRDTTARLWGVAAPVFDQVAKVVEDLDGRDDIPNDTKLAFAAAAVKRFAPTLDSDTARRVAQAAHQYVRLRQAQIL